MLDLLVQVVLDFFRLFLLEQYLVLVVNLCLSEALITLITNICQSLIEPNLLRVVELFEICELLLGCHVDFINSVL